ncbi:MAG: hypothetical protein K2X50_02045 [Gammaproteobacteria bacterium]|nr:hypothetical protein [Gammaproteobacteria bacterium]
MEERLEGEERFQLPATEVLFVLISEAKNKHGEDLKSYTKKITQMIQDDDADINAVKDIVNGLTTTALEIAKDNTELFTFLHEKCGAVRCQQPSMIPPTLLEILTDLDLSDAAMLTDVDFQAVKRHCSFLKRLNLSGCSLITHRAFHSFPDPPRIPVTEIILRMEDLERYGYLYEITFEDINWVRERRYELRPDRSLKSLVAQAVLNTPNFSRVNVTCSNIVLNTHTLANGGYRGISKLKRHLKKTRLDDNTEVLDEGPNLSSSMANLNVSSSSSETEDDLIETKEITEFLHRHPNVQVAIIDGKGFEDAQIDMVKASCELIRQLKNSKTIKEIAISNLPLTEEMLELLNDLVQSSVSIQMLRMKLGMPEDEDTKLAIRYLTRMVKGKRVISIILENAEEGLSYRSDSGAFKEKIESMLNADDKTLRVYEFCDFGYQLCRNTKAPEDLVRKYGVDADDLVSQSDKALEDLDKKREQLEQNPLAIKLSKLIDEKRLGISTYQTSIIRTLSMFPNYTQYTWDDDAVVLDALDKKKNDYWKEYQRCKLFLAEKPIGVSQEDEVIVRERVPAIEQTYFEVLESMQRFDVICRHRNLKLFYHYLRTDLMILLQICGLVVLDSKNKDLLKTYPEFSFLDSCDVFIDFVRGNDTSIDLNLVLDSRLCRRASSIFELVARGVAFDNETIRAVLSRDELGVRQFAYETVTELLNLIITKKALPFRTVEQTAHTLVALKILGIEQALKEYDALKKKDKGKEEGDDSAVKLAFLVKKIQELDQKANTIITTTDEINKTTKESRAQISQVLSNTVDILRYEQQVQEQLKILPRMAEVFESFQRIVLEKFAEQAEIAGEIRALQIEQREAFDEYRVQFDDFSKTSLQLTAEIKASIETVITTLADAPQQADYYFKGTSQVVSFCKEMYIFGAEQIESHANVAKGNEVPGENVLTATLKFAGNMADNIPLPAVPFVVKALCQIATGIYNSHRRGVSTNINNIHMDELLFNLVRATAECYIDTIEELADYDSIKALARTAFILIIKYMTNKDVLKELQSIYDANKNTEDNDVVPRVNILLRGLIIESRLSGLYGTKINFKNLAVARKDKASKWFKDRILDIFGAVSGKDLADKATESLKDTGIKFDSENLGVVASASIKALTVATTACVLKLPTAEDALQRPRTIIVLEKESFLRSFTKPERGGLKKTYLKYLDFYHPCFVNQSVGEMLVRVIPDTSLQRKEPLDDVARHAGHIAAFTKELQADASQELRTDLKAKFLELIIQSQDTVLIGDNFRLEYEQSICHSAVSSLKCLRPQIMVTAVKGCIVFIDVRNEALKTLALRFVKRLSDASVSNHERTERDAVSVRALKSRGHLSELQRLKPLAGVKITHALVEQAKEEQHGSGLDKMNL